MRPTKYNRRVHQAIVERCRDGMPRTLAFKCGGIGARTGWRWLREGRDAPDGRFADLERDVEQAEAEYALELLQIVRNQALAGYWRAAMAFLERRFPNEFGRRDTTVIERGESVLAGIAGQIVVDEEGHELYRKFVVSTRASTHVDGDSSPVLES